VAAGQQQPGQELRVTSQQELYTESSGSRRR
jgi:hypothetical protein